MKNKEGGGDTESVRLSKARHMELTNGVIPVDVVERILRYHLCAFRREIKSLSYGDFAKRLGVLEESVFDIRSKLDFLDMVQSDSSEFLLDWDRRIRAEMEANNEGSGG